jgi:hypothetical protein
MRTRITFGDDHFRAWDKIEFTIKILKTFTEEERKDIFWEFCVYCGRDILPCYCQRDD